MPVLKNAQHEAFCRLVAKGMDADIAYRKVYPRCSETSASAAAARLLAKVRHRVNEFQESSATKNTLDMQERREFLAGVVRAQFTKLAADSPLINRVKRTVKKEGEDFVEYEEIWLPDKRACIMDDAKLAGELVEKTEHSGTIETRQVIVNVPAATAKPRPRK